MQTKNFPHSVLSCQKVDYETTSDGRKNSIGGQMTGLSIVHISMGQNFQGRALLLQHYEILISSHFPESVTWNGHLSFYFSLTT